MTIVLDTETIRTLLSPAGDTPLVNALYKAQYQKSLLRLHQLHRKLSTESPDLVLRTRFSESFAQLSSVPPNAQKAVISYPSFNFWLDRAWEIARQQPFTSASEMHMKMHLEDFGRFVLAAIAKAGLGEYECSFRADQHGHIALPGTASYFESQRIVPMEGVHLAIHNGEMSARKVAKSRQAEVKLVRRIVPQLRSGIEFNVIDMDLRLPGHSKFVYEQLTLLELVKWVSILDEAWEWVVEHEPAIVAEMSLILRAIVPVKSCAVNIHTSGSFKEAPGLIALSWDPDVPVLVDALVHEYHHQKLNALLNLDSLIVGPTSAPVYYSPWRTDARPLIGILHGIYTFQAVLRYWIKVLQARNLGSYEAPIRERIYTLNLQIHTALDTLRKHAVWSPLGEAFFGALVDAMDKWTPRLPAIGLKAQQGLDKRQTEHKTHWDRNHKTTAINT